MRLTGKKVLVLGLGESGLAMARWSAWCGAQVTVADTREQPDRLLQFREKVPDGKFISGTFDALDLNGMDVIAVSPGLRPSVELKTVLAWSAEKGVPVWSEIEMFAQALKELAKDKGYRPAILAVTGTNGKTTTTSLTGHMCRTAGKTIRLAGNISPAALDVLLDVIEKDDLPEVWVLELSSFQLFTTESLEPNAAAVLNVTQDHLDWHGCMQAYADAKARIFGGKTVRVLNREDDWVMAMQSPEDVVVTFGTDATVKSGHFGLHDIRGEAWLSVGTGEGIRDLMPANALRIQGRHNASNALAALALCRAIGLPFKPLLQTLREYRGEPHRVELIATVRGVQYIDDSKGTNVGATLAAVQGLGKGAADRKNIILIAGGLGKGQDFSPLCEAVAANVRAVLLIGKDAGVIHDALKVTGVQQVYCDNLEQAVDRGAALAEENDIVLLSPACASMDMFRSYAHRSQVFVAQVRKIANEVGEIQL
ncbi:MAG: UDP-N-acetylmuramoyl-L-alanine--D-glutamate ligase [Oxalobacter sp.]